MKEKASNPGKASPKNPPTVKKSRPGTPKKPGKVKKAPGFDRWSFKHPVPAISRGKYLKIETEVAAIIHWSADSWQTENDTRTKKNKQGVYEAALKPDTRDVHDLLFTFYWIDAGRWENKDFAVHIVE